MNAARMYNRNESAVSTSIQRLSSGLRINSARDDAAGLAITERMESQIRGLNVGIRNVNDGISLLQTAEGGLEEIGNMIQRMRELSVQAANLAVMSADNRMMLQLEVEQLSSEINRISKNAEFNGVSILNDNIQFSTLDSGDDKLISQIALRDVWLQQSVDRIATEFGLTSSGRDFTVDFDTFTDGAGGTLARVTAGVAGGVGNISNLTLQLDMSDFVDVTTPNGGTGPFYYDRIIAHEVVHAVMFDQTDTTLIDTWFMEGAAEFIHGADERVAGDASGFAVNKAASLAATVDLTGAWGGGSADYSVGYLAVRFIHSLAGGGISSVMDELELGNDLLTAINTATGAGYANMGAFQTAFRAGITAVVSDASLLNTDTGAIGGLDADGGGILDAESVIPNAETPTNNPTNFNMIFPLEEYSNQGPTEYLDFQIGANAGEIIKVGYVAASTKSLGISDIDLVADPHVAISRLDDAIGYVSLQRARIGAQQNRLESAIAVNEISVESLSASRSRILDADYAKETSALTRSLIIQQAATAMTSQAQATSQLAMSLLSQSL